MKNRYKWVVTIFLIFFLYEYITPIVRGIEYGTNLGWTWQETLVNKQIIKHVIRLPLYGLTYLWIFLNIPKRSKTAMWTWRASAWSHIIFKPITGVYILIIGSKVGLLKTFPIISLVFLLVIVGVYLFTLFWIEKYWKIINKEAKQ
jgi:hypothetical protein